MARWAHSTAHMNARSHPADIHVSRCAVAVETGVHHQSGARPRAIRAPRPRNSVRMIQKISPRIR
jgi:hypothetical protein